MNFHSSSYFLHEGKQLMQIGKFEGRRIPYVRQVHEVNTMCLREKITIEAANQKALPCDVKTSYTSHGKAFWLAASIVEFLPAKREDFCC